MGVDEKQRGSAQLPACWAEAETCESENEVDEHDDVSARLLTGSPAAHRFRRAKAPCSGVAGACAVAALVLVLAGERGVLGSGPGRLHRVRPASRLGLSPATHYDTLGGYDTKSDAATNESQWSSVGENQSEGQASSGDDSYGRTTTPVPCGWVEENVYYPGHDLLAVQAGSAEACCSRCARQADCVAWSWERSTLKCLLKGRAPPVALTWLKDERYVSGQPTQARHGVPYNIPQVGQSLFCFSLMLPHGYEPVLIAWQFEKGVGIFGCEEYAVYSNATLTITPGLVSTPVASNLQCNKGGEFKTALNIDIFMAVWTRVASDGRFRAHDWTAKADPDAVFLPARLRGYVRRHSERTGGVYLNNCRRGMHGPVEVLSRLAVEKWWSGIPSCQVHFGELCSGPCEWGEDMFLDQCLHKVLQVAREDELSLLVEEACDPPQNWHSCQDAAAAAFHPFKDIESFSACLLATQR